MDNYETFLETKLKTVHKSGFEVDPETLNKNLFPFQRWIVTRALEKGKFAIWADCGLGKTLMQLDYARQVSIETGKPVLILCPLAVAGQTIKEGEKFGIPVSRLNIETYATEIQSFRRTVSRLGVDYFTIYITNYDQLKNIDCSVFGGVVLDESSILKNFAGATRNRIIDSFKDTPYKLACTATPSPNDPIEIGNHSEFLDVLPSVEMVSRFFTVDHKNKSNKYRMKGHAVKDFYRWVASWAIMIQKPSDIGFEYEGYDLPPLNMHEVEIQTPPPPGMLFNTEAISATEYHSALRVTIVERLEQVAEIVNGTDENFLIWTRQLEEDKQLKKLIPGSVVVAGSDKDEYKEKHLLGFSNDEFRVLITKPKIAQYGLNYQNCRNMVFTAPDFSFEGLYQAIRREWRYGQKKPVNVYIVTTDNMANVISSIRRKQRQFEQMQKEMSEAISLAVIEEQESPKIISTEESKEAGKWKLVNGDSFRLIKDVGTDSIDAMIFSPPFSHLYGYSADPADLSNCITNEQFFYHFGFMGPELLRVLKPGRMCAIHMMQLTTMVGRDGYHSIVDFRGDLIRLFQSWGFILHAEVTIFKRPDLAATRTKNHQLLHKTTKRDSTINRPGLADYLLVFRKPGENQVPVNHNGDGIPFDDWVEIASPIWWTINENDTLNTATAKASDDERHITPTQLPVIERFNILYTNPGELVFSPFSGIGSEGYQSILQGRRYLGFELKQDYHEAAIKNLRAAEELTRQKALF